MSIMTTAGLRALHRWLGIIACLGALLWTISGMLHPVLVRVQPQPVTFEHPALKLYQQIQSAIAPADIAHRYDIQTAVWLRIVQLPGGAYYQLRQTAEAIPRYFSLADGNELTEGDQQYARMLVRHYLGDAESDITAVDQITSYAGEYDAINRVLPVYRVQFDRPDHMRAYVDTSTSLLGTLVDDRKSIFDWQFRNLHKWDWLNSQEPLRLLIALVLLTAALSTAITGLVTFFKTRNQQSLKLPWWHRWLGLVMSLILITFASSGGFHLVKMSVDDTLAQPLRMAEAMPLKDLTQSPVNVLSGHADSVSNVSLVSRGDELYYRAELSSARSGSGGHGQDDHSHNGGHDTHVHHTSAVSGPTVVYVNAHSSSEENITVHDHARHIATVLTSLPATAITEVNDLTGFDGEYGFINKFLPVTRIVFNTDKEDTVYIHTASGTLAAYIDNLDRFEGWVFAYFHKWHFMEPLGMDLRDGIMAACAFLICVVTLLGITLFVKRYRRQDK